MLIFIVFKLASGFNLPPLPLLSSLLSSLLSFLPLFPLLLPSLFKNSLRYLNTCHLGQVFYVSTRPRNKHRGGLYEECAYCELSVLIIHCWNYTFQPCRRDKVQTSYNYLDLGVGLGQLPLNVV